MVFEKLQIQVAQLSLPKAVIKSSLTEEIDSLKQESTSTTIPEFEGTLDKDGLS